MDLAPTLLALLSIPPNGSQHLDGLDLRPLLVGQRIRERNLFWYTPHYTGVNKGSDNRGALPPFAVVRSRNWKLVQFYVPPPAERGRARQLYNLASDPRESRDWSELLPETADALAALLTRHLANLGAPLPLAVAAAARADALPPVPWPRDLVLAPDPTAFEALPAALLPTVLPDVPRNAFKRLVCSAEWAFAAECYFAPD